ncbi:MAG: tRNA (cytidine(34)-2'-O)-methyltransferase [Alphaproteobacteria bacterium]|nr:tRNA (cytidine(34)-2'-O)-methyltransferase [Alphaproteobacteria bacterium]
MRLALFEPDIPQNTGALMRLCACLKVPLDIIEPCGFLLSDKNLKRAGMDYLEHLDLTRHLDWDAFKAATAGKRLVLISTKSSSSFLDFSFAPDDILIAGRESAGVPDHVHQQCAARLKIPMIAAARSLNVALASGIVLGEALRQTGGYPLPAGTE